MKPIMESMFPVKGISPSADTVNREKMEKVCADFEAVLLNKFLEAARKNTLGDGIFGQSFASDIFKSMQNEELAKHLAHHGGIGLGDALYRQLASQPPSEKE